ncbi:hypothetical protein K504DRAFT_336027, partial [Pleomassaria siparia CBS 279.74]
WLLRQSLFLELLYHNLSMSLYRPFISFTSTSSQETPTTDDHAASCARHAVTVTNTLHQVLTETDLLTGMSETFQWQWDAMLPLIGYLLAYPIGQFTFVARKALSTAMTVFELLCKNFENAADAANVDLLIDRHRTSL